MLVTWSEADIVSGQVYGKPSTAERWIIGYVQPPDGPVEYTSISLADGLVQPTQPKTEIAADLTRNGYLPVQLLESR